MKLTKPIVSFAEGLGILIALLAILGYLVIGQKLTPHISIPFVFMLLLLYDKWKGFPWDEIHEGIVEGTKPRIISIIILSLIGVLVATWILSGMIPTIMVYGFKIISVKFFLPTVLVVCALVDVTAGSSFMTVSAMGTAFLDIGHIPGFDSAMTASAVVLGAFLGDNISPLSGTTNLAAGISGVNLFEYILNMMYTVVLAFITSIVGYIFLGHQSGSADLRLVDVMVQTLHQGFWTSPIALLPVAALFLFAWKKIPAIPTSLVGSTVVVILAFISDHHLSSAKVSTILMSSYVADIGDQSIDTLLSRGGIESMLDSAALIILTLGLGGLLIKFNIVATSINKTKGCVNNPVKLIASTALSSTGINPPVGEQHLPIILPGETFKSSFTRLGIDKKYLTRTLADAGAAVNSLIPWGIGGTFIMGTLKVGALEYLPYTFSPLLYPIITVILGISLKKQQGENKKVPGTNAELWVFSDN